MFRFSIAAAAIALALSGCQTTGTIEQTVQRTLPQICDAAETAHLSLLIVAEAGAVSPATMRRADAAWVTLEPLCVDPDNVTAADILFAAATAYVVITAALRDAQE